MFETALIALAETRIICNHTVVVLDSVMYVSVKNMIIKLLVFGVHIVAFGKSSAKGVKVWFRFFVFNVLSVDTT